MKRKLYAILGLAAMLVSNASITFAAAAAAGSEFTAAAGATVQYSVDSGTTYKDLTKLSNGVVLRVFINTARTEYALSTKHNNAPREYGTSSQDTKMFYHDLATAATAMTTLSASDSSQVSAWTSM
jgi:hypothetical protein